MSMGPPLAKVALCFSNQSLKPYGDITFIVFIWKGASGATSAVCSKVGGTQIRAVCTLTFSVMCKNIYLDLVCQF